MGVCKSADPWYHLGPIRRSDLIFVQIRIRVTLKIFRGI